jgi:hypothetical protein
MQQRSAETGAAFTSHSMQAGASGLRSETERKLILSSQSINSPTIGVNGDYLVFGVAAEILAANTGEQCNLRSGGIDLIGRSWNSRGLQVVTMAEMSCYWKS